MADEKVSLMGTVTPAADHLVHLITGVSTTPDNNKATLSALFKDIAVTSAETSAGVTPTDLRYEPGNVLRYGAIPNNVFNSTAAVNKAIAAAATTADSGLYRTPIIFPPADDRYRCGDLDPIVYSDVIMTGATIEAIDGATTVFNLGREDTDLWRYRTFTGGYIRGNSRATDGVTFSDDASGNELAGRWIMQGTFFENCNRAIYKPKGNLGNIFIGVTTAASNFGYFAKDSQSPNIMHPGMDTFIGGRHAEHILCAFYTESNVESVVGLVLDQVIFEDNVAFALVVDGWNLASTALHLRSVVFENNNTGSASVDLGQGQGSETPRDILFRDVDHAIITGSHIRSQGWEFINSMVTTDGCFTNAASVLSRDSSSVVRFKDANLNGIDGGSNVIIESLTQQRKPSGNDGITMVAQIPPRDHIVTSLPGSGVAVYSNSFAFSDYTFSGVSSGGGVGTRTKVTSDGGPGIYDWYNNYTFTSDVVKTDDLAAIVANKWYVVTDSLRVVSGEIGTLDFKSADVTLNLVNNLDSPLRDNVADGDWVTLGSVVEYTDSTGSGNIRYHVARTAGQATEYDQGLCQIIQFDTQQEATDYFNSRAFYQAEDFDYSGVATTSSGSIAIDFTDEGFQDQPDAIYNIEMATDGDATLFYSSKSATGFTINNGAGTNTVNWRVYRRDV